LTTNPHNLPSFEQHWGEAPTPFPKQFLVPPTFVLATTLQYCDGVYINKGKTNNKKQIFKIKIKIK
jgi:hypothetical protein